MTPTFHTNIAAAIRKLGEAQDRTGAEWCLTVDSRDFVHCAVVSIDDTTKHFRSSVRDDLGMNVLQWVQSTCDKRIRGEDLAR